MREIVDGKHKLIIEGRLFCEFFFFFSSRRRHTRSYGGLEFRRVLFRSKFGTTDETIEDVKSMALKEGRVRKGDIVINTASAPLHWKGSTNMLKISIVE